MRVSKPQDLPDFRLWLIEQWKPYGLYYKIAAATSHWGLEIGPDVVPLEPEFDLYALNHGALWWVTADMSRLVQHAAATLPETTLTEDLLPSDYGLVVFEEPLQGTAGDTGDEIRVSAILWGANIKLRHGEECLTAATYSYYEIDDDPHWVPCGRSDWEFGTDTQAVLLEGVDAVRLNSISEDRRWLAALWLLASQPLADTTQAPMPRAIVRRSARSKLPADVHLIDVRAPRRSQPAEPGERTVEWSHRWIVGGEHGGFWRQQAYGPNHSLRRPQWISEYIKGPPDKPLQIRDTVRVVRDRPSS